MQKSGKEIADSVKGSLSSMMLLVLSVISFIVLLWIVMALVRFVVGFTL